MSKTEWTLTDRLVVLVELYRSGAISKEQFDKELAKTHRELNPAPMNDLIDLVLEVTDEQK